MRKDQKQAECRWCGTGRFILCIIWGLVLLMGQPGRADDFFRIKDQIIHTAWKKVGWLYIMPRLLIQNMGYSSNIYQYASAEASDWTTDAGIEVTASLIIKNRLILQVFEQPYYSYYRENDELRSFSNVFKASAYTHLGALNFKYQYEKPYIWQRPTTEFGHRVRMDNEYHTLAVDWGRQDRFFFSVTARRNQFKYKNIDYEGNIFPINSLDRRDDRIAASLNHRIFTRTVLSYGIEFGKQDFSQAAERNRKEEALFIGVQFPEISSITGSIRMGIKRYRPQNPEYGEFTLPFGQGRVSVKIWRRIKVSLDYQMDNFYSFYNLHETFNVRRIGAGIEYYLSKKFKIGYKYDHHRLLYEDAVSGEQTREDTFQSSSISLGVKLFHRMGLGIAYTRQTGISSLPGLDRNYDFIGGYITHEF